MKKVLYLITRIERTGPNVVLENMIKNIDRNLYHVGLVSLFKGDKKQEEIIENTNVDTYYLNYSNKIQALFHGLTDISRIIIDEGYEIVHSHCLLPDYFNSKLKNVKKISTIHCVFNEDYKFQYGKIIGLFLSKIHINIIYHNDMNVCCSKSVYDSLIQSKITNLCFINNGIDINVNPSSRLLQDQLKRQLHINENSMVYIFTGKLIKRKNVELLVNYFSKSFSDTLIVVGSGAQENYLRSIATPNIIFAGFQEDIMPFLSIADVYISASVSEGLSISVIEALANNLFLFLSDNASHNELFKINKQYYIGETFNKNNFNTKKKLLKKRIKEHKFDKKSREEFQYKYLSGESMMKGYMIVYEKF